VHGIPRCERPCCCPELHRGALHCVVSDVFSSTAEPHGKDATVDNERASLTYGATCAGLGYTCPCEGLLYFDNSLTRRCPQTVVWSIRSPVMEVINPQVCRK